MRKTKNNDKIKPDPYEDLIRSEQLDPYESLLKSNNFIKKSNQTSK